MKRWLYSTGLLALGLAMVLLASCARMDQRGERYNPKQCPFCTMKPGVCNYCNGSGKCSFCQGTGTRVNSTNNIPDPDIRHVTYTTPCPFCKATGTCRYCDGRGKCWACKGLGTIESWEFYEKYKAEGESAAGGEKSVAVEQAPADSAKK
jgi:hypothetical protein